MQTATLASTARAAPGWFAAIPAWLEALAVAGAIALVLHTEDAYAGLPAKSGW